MITLCDKKLCSGCGACFAACPAQAIEMKRDSEGFVRPEVIRGKCVGCGICEKSCPVLSIKKGGEEPKAYGAYNKDGEIRAASSSGGVFTLLAQQVIDGGGVVYGAAFDDEFRSVRHIGAKNEEELKALRGSKYVQSEAFSVFSDVQKQLKDGVKVLFSGTPCQIEGLRGFLAKRYDNLLCVDMICHGVPSQKVWQKYIEQQEKQAGAPSTAVSFTDKSNGWSNRRVKLSFANGTEKVIPQGKDSFMKAFSANISLRESCSNCVAKKLNRLSDITLADFWGVNRLSPALYDNKGTSLLMIHSKKGAEALELIKDKLELVQTDLASAVAYNGAAIHSVIADSKRGEFFAALDNGDFEETVSRYVKTKKSLRGFLSSIASRVRK